MHNSVDKKRHLVLALDLKHYYQCQGEHLEMQSCEIGGISS